MSAEGALDVGGDHLAGPEAADRGAGFAVRLGTGHLGFLSGGCWWRGGGGEDAAQDQGDTGSSGSGIGCEDFCRGLGGGGQTKFSYPLPDPPKVMVALIREALLREVFNSKRRGGSENANTQSCKSAKHGKL